VQEAMITEIITGNSEQCTSDQRSCDLEFILPVADKQA